MQIQTKTSVSLFTLVGLLVATPMTAAISQPSPTSAQKTQSEPALTGAFRGSDMLPLAWQKRPKVQFNVVTEMSPTGRQKRVPTRENPLYYSYTPLSQQFVQMGIQPAAGEKPPPQAELEQALREALAASGYLPVANDRQRPDVLIVFSYGSHSTDGGSGEAAFDDLDYSSSSAEELVNGVIQNIWLMKDVVERARLVAGDQVAYDLKTALEAEVFNRFINRTYVRHVEMVGGDITMAPVNPAADSPFQMFLHSSRTHEDLMRPLAETIFHGCYFVEATAFDFDGVARKQRIPLWRTKMTVNSQGVSLEEVLRPLILTAGPYLGREMSAPAVFNRRIDREGNVELGEARVVSAK